MELQVRFFLDRPASAIMGSPVPPIVASYNKCGTCEHCQVIKAKVTGPVFNDYDFGSY
jgi:hypothetical protein